MAAGSVHGAAGLSFAEQEAAGGGGGRAAKGMRRPRGWTAVAFIIGFFAAASMASSSFGTPLASYLISRYNMKGNAATNVSNVYSGLLSFAPVVGAFVADSFWGRFRTMLFGSVFGVIGMVVITLSATIRQLKPPSCSAAARQAGTCAGPSALHRAVLYVGMGLLVVSAGGTNPTALPFGADQFDETNERHKAGLTRYFNWYYAVAMMATFLALTVIVYVQDKVSWGLGFAIPTVLTLVTFAVFLAGTAVYVYVPPEGSIFSSVARVVVASCRKWRLRLPHPDDARRQEEVLYSYSPPVPAAGNDGPRRVFRLPLTLQLSFLNKAAFVTDADEVRPDGSPARPWNLCSVQQVEEVKCLVKIIPMWVSGVVWFVVLTEMSNYTYIQALTMDLHMGSRFTIPPVSILAVFNLSVALFAPVFDLLISGAARYLTKAGGGGGGVTLLQRQGAGLVVGSLALVVAAAVERRRRDSALGHGDGVSPLSAFLLAPQLAVMGASGALSMIGQMEFYNTQFPDQMRTLANAAFYCAQGASSYLATLAVDVVNARTRRRGGSAGWVSDDINAGRIDYFYYTMAVLGAVNFVYFLVCSHFYRYKGEQAPESAGPELPSDTDSARTSGTEAALLKT
ncbi:hypothetical protein PAHAL_9G097600 [Panicum hallii]|uniref:Major facilitator superfamily (MFS) profile domain-containing protein n=1 Tax=Panicum hallii TaxID=206008 RepID=A0A2S3IIC2_9POAL|nr:protein NRT1/ PTR FAMILY 2.13-like [Panicum hallii]PAN45158.1 hypothetical protein PAHAL_9G097600 [Panicum hallii]